MAPHKSRKVSKIQRQRLRSWTRPGFLPQSSSNGSSPLGESPFRCFWRELEWSWRSGWGPSPVGWMSLFQKQFRFPWRRHRLWEFLVGCDERLVHMGKIISLIAILNHEGFCHPYQSSAWALGKRHTRLSIYFIVERVRGRIRAQ